jgi:hypothetical protein
MCQMCINAGINDRRCVITRGLMIAKDDGKAHGTRECAQVPTIIVVYVRETQVSAEMLDPKGKQSFCLVSFTFIKVRAFFNGHVFNTSYRYKRKLIT